MLTKDIFGRAMETSPAAARTISMIAKERFSSYVKHQNSGDTDVDFGDELKLGITNDDLKNVYGASYNNEYFFITVGSALSKLQDWIPAHAGHDAQADNV